MDSWALCPMTNSSHRNVRPHSDLQGAHSWLSSFRVSQSEKKLKSLSHVRLFVTPWTINTVHGILQARVLEWVTHSLLQGIFPTQGQTLYCQSHQGSSRILEWVAIPFSRASSWPRNRTGVPPLRVDSLPAELPRKPGPSQSFLCPFRS